MGRADSAFTQRDTGPDPRMELAIADFRAGMRAKDIIKKYRIGSNKLTQWLDTMRFRDGR